MAIKHFLRLPLVLVIVCVVTSGLARDKGHKPKRSLPPKSFDKKVENLFSANPFGLLRGARPAPATGGAQPKNPGGSGSTGTPVDTSPGGFAWSKIISADTVTNEIKAHNTLVAGHVRTPGVFKGGGNRELRMHFGVLGVMFGIAAEFDGSIRWQKDAGGARDAFGRAGINAKAADTNTFNESKRRSEDLDEMIRGGSVDFSEPKEEFLWSDIAERRQLMKRLNLAHEDRLRKWTANRGDFDRNLDKVKHEAEIIAALAEVIQHEDYDAYDDEEYVDFCKQLMRHARAVADAAQQKDLGAAQTAAGEISKTCSACHEDFKG